MFRKVAQTSYGKVGHRVPGQGGRLRRCLLHAVKALSLFDRTRSTDRPEGEREGELVSPRIDLSARCFVVTRTGGLEGESQLKRR